MKGWENPVQGNVLKRLLAPEYLVKQDHRLGDLQDGKTAYRDVMRIALPDLRAAVIAVLFMIYMVGHGCCVNNNMTYGLRSLGPALESDGNAAFNITSNLAGTIGIVIASGIVSSFQVGSADIGEGTLAGVKVVLTLLVAVVVALNIFGFQVLRQKSVK